MAKYNRKQTKVQIRTILNSAWAKSDGKLLFGFQDLDGSPNVYLRVFITQSDKSFDTFGNEGDLTTGDLEIQIFTSISKADPDDAETVVEALDTILNRRVIDSGLFYFDRSRVLFNTSIDKDYNMSNYSISFRSR